MNEPVSALSHLLAAPPALAVGVWLIARSRGHAARTLALSLFTVAVVILLVVSGIYHWLPHGTSQRALFRRLDHAAIWTMIASTFTAVHLLGFRGRWRWSIPAVVWAIAIFGIVFKLAFFDTFSELVWLMAYLGLGWLGIVSTVHLARRGRWRVVGLLLLGGAAYTSGAVLEYWHAFMLVPELVGPHEIFHVAVIAGMVLHWRLVWRLGESLEDYASSMVASP